MEIVNRKLSELTPYDRNPRKNDEAVKYVKASIEQFGFKIPIIIDAGGTVVAGHTRLKAAKELGMNEVPCIVADDLTPDQIKAFRLADNKTAEMAEWDDKLLQVELLDLVKNFDMAEFGFENISDGSGLEIDSDNSENHDAAISYLTFGDQRIPITDEELTALNRVLDEYTNREGVVYGFGLWLAQRN